MPIHLHLLDPARLEEEAARTAHLAAEIWTEYYTPLIGRAQVDYMLEQFQSGEAIARDIREHGYRYWLAEDDAGMMIGYCAAVAEPKRLFLSKLYIRQSQRGHGLARQFIDLLEDWRTEDDLGPIQLTVNKYNHPSIAAYEHLGFLVVDAVVTDIGGGFQMDDYIMERTGHSAPRPATVVLWRHGVTEWNDQHRFQGCNANPGLTEVGLAQATQAAPLVARFSPDTIVCSPLTRARQTCAQVESLLATSPLIDERLREIDVGSWCGLTTNQVRSLDPQYGTARDLNLDYRHGGTGETATELGQRAGAAIRDWSHAGQTTLVVSHGWALQMGTANLLGWDYAQSRWIRVMANCAVSVLTRTGKCWRIEAWNVMPDIPPAWLGRLANR